MPIEIHEHPAVVFLMTTEFWPKGLSRTREHGWQVNGFFNTEDFTQWDQVAHSLIFSAAVRWLGSMGWTVFIRGGVQVAYCEITRGKQKVVKSAVTDLHAMLDAVEAVRKKESEGPK